jgi:hypothetical protein
VDHSRWSQDQLSAIPDVIVLARPTRSWCRARKAMNSWSVLSAVPSAQSPDAIFNTLPRAGQPTPAGQALHRVFEPHTFTSRTCQVLCVATTADNGTATCNATNVVGAVNSLLTGYTAKYAGNSG